MKKLGLGIVCLVLIFNGIIYAANGVLPGSGTENDPYLIEDLADFDAFADDANAGMYWAEGVYTKLMCGIDLSGRTYYKAVIVPGSTFNGSFDGNDHSINNLSIQTNENTHKNIGLFGNVSGTIKNLSLLNSQIVCNDYAENVGLLCGRLWGGYITHCRIEGEINCFGATEAVGGLCGECVIAAHSSYIYNTTTLCSVVVGNNSSYTGGICGYLNSDMGFCNSEGTIEGWDNVGGLSGLTRENSIVTNCQSHCNVKGRTSIGGFTNYTSDKSHHDNCSVRNCYATGNVNGTSQVGGFIGSGYAIHCYSTGDVSGDHAVGGFCGYGSALECYSTGNVSGNNAIGGFCGRISRDWDIINCFSYGSVNSPGTDIGGFIGYRNTYENGVAKNCYWDVESSNIGVPGENNHGSIGLSTEEMKSSTHFRNAGWNIKTEIPNHFDNAVWIIESGSYPKFVWETSNGTLPGNGTYDNPHIITTIEQFDIFACTPYFWLNNIYTILNSDINLDGRIYSNSVIAPLFPHFTTHGYYGCFNAQGHTIDNLTIIPEKNSSAIGLFSLLSNENSYIVNLNVTNINISTENADYDVSNKYYCGGVCGSCGGNATLKNCITSGTLVGIYFDTDDITKKYSAGGICSSLGNGYIDNCHSSCNIKGHGGGLCGRVNTGKIINSSASGDIVGDGGGLCGISKSYKSLIQNSYATGNISGITCIGGLIGYNEGNVKNCFAKGNVSGINQTGGLIGYNKYYVENCYAHGNVYGQVGSIETGGLIGLNTFRIAYCYSTGSVNTEPNSRLIGGLIGRNSDGVRNCYSKSHINTADSRYAGGLCGFSSKDSIISNCYYSGNISAINSTDLSGITTTFGDIKNCFWNIDSSGVTPDMIPIYQNTNAIGLHTYEMATIETYINAGWEFISPDNPEGIWFMDDYPVLAALSEIVNIPDIVNLSLADGYNRLADNGLKIGKLHYVKSFNIPFGEIISQSREPGDYTTTETLIDLEVSSGLPVELSGNGTETNPYKITTLDEFDSFAFNHDYWQENVYTELTVDLDLNPEGIGRSIYPSAIIAADIDSSKPFFQGIEYNGIFNGNGHTISNIQINTSGNDNDYIGLFGKLGPDAVISDLTINNASILIDQTCYYIGILCGDNQGLITKCKTSGTIDCSLGADYLGGLCGINNGGQIEQSYSEANIYGTSSSRPIGGLVAENAGGIISNCHYTGSISGSSNLGGLCGINSDGTILECFSSGKVTSNNDSLSIGGLCGYNEWGEISNSYSAVEIICNQNGKRIGGLCGDNNEGIISNCYTTSDIDLGRSTTYAGGFCGENYKGKIENSYSIAKLQLDHNDIYGGFCGRNLDEVINCFWDEQDTEIDISDGGEAKNTEQMQSFATYLNAEWSINESVETDWIMLSSDYPKLAWQQGIFTKGEMEISLKPNQNGKITIQLYTLSDDNFVWKINDIESCPWITSISPNYGEFTKAGEMVNIEINIDSSGLAVGDYLFQMPVKIFSNQADYFLTSLHVVDTVDLYDFSLLAEWWLLNCENNSECNLIDSNNDYIINFDDLNNLADQWLSSSSNNNGFIADFETGQLSSYGFKIPDTFAWEVQSEEISSGNYAARTGVISDNQQSKIEIIVNCSEGDAISFDRKVSSEQIWDTLSFYIDDVLYDQWSGELDWESFVYDVMPGVHSFRWEYSKDESISEGLDAAWLDDVRID